MARVGKKVSRTDVGRMIVGPDVTPDPAQLSQHGIRAYLIGPDQLLIVERQGGGVLYPKDFFLSRFAKAMEGAAKAHYLAGRELPPEFPLRVQQLVVEARELIANVTRKSGDLTVPGLAVVDAFVRKVGREACLEPQTLPMLVAYVGETLRLAKTGRWEIRAAADPDLASFQEAWIVGADGWDWDASWLVVRAVRDRTARLRVAAEGALREPGWGPRS